MFDIIVEVVQEEREVEHTVSLYKPRHLLKTEYTNKKNLYGYNNNNYLDEDIPIMCFDPYKITFFGYDIFQVYTKSSGKFNIPHYLFDNIALLLHKHPWN